MRSRWQTVGSCHVILFVFTALFSSSVVPWTTNILSVTCFIQRNAKFQSIGFDQMPRYEKKIRWTKWIWHSSLYTYRNENHKWNDAAPGLSSSASYICFVDELFLFSWYSTLQNRHNWCCFLSYFCFFFVLILSWRKMSKCAVVAARWIRETTHCERNINDGHWPAAESHKT